MKFYIFVILLVRIKKMELGKLINTYVGGKAEMELNLSVDCIIFTIQKGELKVLLNKPFPDARWGLPGGFMFTNEEAKTAAARILKQRTGAGNIYLNQFKIFSKPNRFSFQEILKLIPLPEGQDVDLSTLPERVISIGFFALVNYDSIHVTGGDLNEKTYWTDVKAIPELMFDHNEIVQEAVEALRKELYFKPIAYNLLPEKFTMPELQKLYEIILDKTIERSSFQKKMLKWNIYERLEERREGVAHKRPFLYRFDKQKYEEAIKQGIRFGI